MFIKYIINKEKEKNKFIYKKIYIILGYRFNIKNSL